MQSRIAFYLDGQPVGSFSGPHAPIAAGEYAYEPYRGPGHYTLTTQLKTSQTPRCHYTLGTTRVEFSVVAHVRYGVLRLSGFELFETAP